MKKTGLILIGILWLLAGVQFVGNRGDEKKEKMMEVLGRVGVLEKTIRVEYEGLLQEKVVEEKVLLEEIHAITGEGDIKLCNSENGAQSYLFISLEFLEDTKEAFHVKEKLEKLLSPYVSTVQSSVNVIGSLKGQLSLEQRNLVADELLKEMEAQVVTEHRTMELFTIYAYTPYITECKLQKNQAVNVNIAMDYNEEEDRTYLYAAVPVIGVEY